MTASHKASVIIHNNTAGKQHVAIIHLFHSVLTICTQTGTCDTRSGDLVFFPAAFDEFSLFTKNLF